MQLGLLDARHVAGDLALTVRAAHHRPRRLAQHRRPSGCPNWTSCAVNGPSARASCSTSSKATSRRPGADCGTPPPCARSPRPGSRTRPGEGLAEARRRLLDVRDALHQCTGRATDRLALQEQDAVAAELGLLDADVMLRQVSESARVISYAGDVTWREVGRVLRARSARPRLRRLFGGGHTGAPARTPLAEGVVEQDGEVVLALTARPEKDPVLPLRAAAAAAQAGPAHLPARRAPPRRRRPAAAGALARRGPRPARHAARRGRRPPSPVWEALEAEGLITRLLPDWERVRCRPQRNAVHTWTVDRHLVETAVRASRFTRRVHRPDLLLIAALLHDIGKGWPGDHSVAGEAIARDIAARIGFGAADVAVVATLVRHHLLLIETATRRDLDDPATVRAVAEAVGSHRHPRAAARPHRGGRAGHRPRRLVVLARRARRRPGRAGRRRPRGRARRPRARRDHRRTGTPRRRGRTAPAGPSSPCAPAPTPRPRAGGPAGGGTARAWSSSSPSPTSRACCP